MTASEKALRAGTLAALTGAGLLAAASAEASPWSQVQCAGKTSFALTAQGTLFGTGLRTDGELGDTPHRDFPFSQKKWKRVLNQVHSIATDGGTSIALRRNGTVWATGANDMGQTGEGKAGKKFKTRRTWKKVFRAAAAVDAGGLDTYVLGNDGTLWVSGVSNLGDRTYLISGSVPIAYSITWKATLDQVSWFTSNGIGAIAGRNDGSLWSITYEPFGLALKRWQPMPAIANVVSVESDGTNYFVITGDSILYHILDTNSDGALNGQDDTHGNGQIEITPIASNAASVQAGVYGTYLTALDGTLFWWKEVDNGFGHKTRVWFPVLNDVASMCIGDSHVLAVKRDGSLWGAGDNTFGQFGNPAIASTGSAENWVQLQQ